MLWRDSFTIDYVEAFAVRAMLRLRDEGKCVDTVGVDTRVFPFAVLDCSGLLIVIRPSSERLRRTKLVESFSLKFV